MWLAFGAFESAHKGVSWCMAVATVRALFPTAMNFNRLDGISRAGYPCKAFRLNRGLAIVMTEWRLSWSAAPPTWCALRLVPGAATSRNKDYEVREKNVGEEDGSLGCEEQSTKSERFWGSTEVLSTVAKREMEVGGQKNHPLDGRPRGAKS